MNQSQSFLLLLAFLALCVKIEAVVVDEVNSTEHNIRTGWARASGIPYVVEGDNTDDEADDDADGDADEDNDDGPKFTSMLSAELRRRILVGFDSPEKEASFVHTTKQRKSGSAIVDHEYHYSKTVRMEVTEEEYQAMLQAQVEEGRDKIESGILYIEEDVEVHAAYPKPKSQPRQNQLRQEQPKQERVHRKLQERVSYALDMVQGFDYIPPSHEAQQCQVKICIVDSGLHVDHYDIPYSRGTPYVDGEEFGLPSNQYWFNPNSNTDHGTAIAGIIAARGGNSKGTLGIVSQGPEASKVCLLNARIFPDDDYTTTTGYVLEAAEWCADKGANIINLSLASPAATNTDRSTYQTLYNKGILLIAAAGNSGTTEYNYPASLDAVISVGSIGPNRKQSSFSQTNNRIELVAPGKEIYSTSGSDMDYFTGTSFATPYVAGIAAKIWAAHPKCTNKQIREALQKSAQPLGTNPAPTSRFGYGLIRAREADRYIKEKMYWPCGIMPEPTPGPPTKQPTRHPTRAPTPGPTFPPQEGVSSPANPPTEDLNGEEPLNPHCQVEQLSCDGDFTTLGDLSKETTVSAAGVSKTRQVRICCPGLSCQTVEGSNSKVCIDMKPHIISSATTVGSRWSFFLVGSTTAFVMLYGLL